MTAFHVRPRLARPDRGVVARASAIGRQATTGACTLSDPTGDLHAIGHQATAGHLIAGDPLSAFGFQATTSRTTPALVVRGTQATRSRVGGGGASALGRQGTRSLVTPSILCRGRQATLGQVAPGGGIGAFANGYDHRARLDLPGQVDLSGTLTNLVFRLKPEVLAAAELKTVANGGKVRSAAGFDIRFELGGDDAGGTGGVKLDHQFVIPYDPTAGAIDVRLRIPSWAVTADYRPWLYVGKAGLAASEENPTGLWTGAMRATRLDTGADLSGGARALSPSGVTPGFSLAGMPAGRFAAAGYCRKLSPAYVGHLTAVTNEIVFRLDAVPGLSDQGNLDRVGGTPLSAQVNARYSSWIDNGGRINAGANWYDAATGKQNNGSVQTGAGSVDAGLTHVMAVRQSSRDAIIYKNGVPLPATVINPATAGYVNVLANDEDTVGAGEGAQTTCLPGLYAIDVHWSQACSAAFCAMRYRSEIECRSVAGMGAFDAAGDANESPVAAPWRTTNDGTQQDYDVAARAFDSDGDPVTLTDVKPSTHGGDTTSLTGGKVRYARQPGWAGGVAEVPFTVGDGRGKASSSYLRLVVAPAIAGGAPMYVPALPASFQRIASDAALTSFLNSGPNPAAVYALVSKGVALGARTISQAIGSKAHPLYIVAERNSADQEDFAGRATIGRVTHSAPFAWLDGFVHLPPNNDFAVFIDADDTFVTRGWFKTDYQTGGVKSTVDVRGYRTRLGFCLFNSVDRYDFVVSDIEQRFTQGGVGTTNPDFWDMYGNAHVSTETKAVADGRVGQNGMALYASPGFDPPGTDPGDISQHNSWFRRAFVRTTTKHGVYTKHVPNMAECDGTFTSSDGLHPYGSHAFAFRGGSSRYGKMLRLRAAGQPGSNSTGGQAIALQSWNHELGWCEATTGPIRLYCLCTGPKVKPLQAARYAYVYRCSGVLVLGAVRNDTQFTPTGKLMNVVVEAHTGPIIDEAGNPVTFDGATGQITSTHPWVETTGPDACKIFAASSKPVKPAFSLTRGNAGPGGGPQAPWDGVGRWPSAADFS
jgi:hypothetical protein